MLSMQPQQDAQTNPSLKCSLHEFMQVHILSRDIVDIRSRALDMTPHYFANHPTDYILSFKDLLKHQSHKYINILELYDKYHAPNPSLFKQMTSTESVGTFSLTNLLCYPAIEYLGSSKQFEYYSKLIEEGRLIGAYAQTEITHGSDVQNLATEAVYSPSKKCLVFNTPTKHGIKFWPGGLGVFGTHVITQAKLIVEGKSYGLQTFIVQIRDTKAMQPLKGISVGDLGPKLGFRGADNGYLEFTNYEAPIDTLLARFIQIDENGKVTKSEDKNADKIAYGSMMTLRGNLLRFFSKLVAKGIEMSNIYRKVGSRNPYEIRRDIDKLTHYYSFGLCAGYMKGTLKRFLDSYHKDEKKALKMIPEIHFLTSGFKAISSWKVVKTTRDETTSISLGDLLMTGVVQLYSDVVPTPTYEGDNVVLMQQVIRVILGSYTNLMSGKSLPKSLKFLNKYQNYALEQQELNEVIEVNSSEELLSLEDKILENFAFKMIQGVCKKIQKSAMEDGVPLKRVMSEGLQPELIQVAYKVFEIVNLKLVQRVYEEKEVAEQLHLKDFILLGKLLKLQKLVFIKDNLNGILESKIVKLREDVEEIVNKAKETYYVDLVPELDYLYTQGFYTQKELSSVKDFKNLGHRVYVQASQGNEKTLKESQAGLLKLSKL